VEVLWWGLAKTLVVGAAFASFFVVLLLDCGWIFKPAFFHHSHAAAHIYTSKFSKGRRKSK
jgi:hypothetical protein